MKKATPTVTSTQTAIPTLTTAPTATKVIPTNTPTPKKTATERPTQTATPIVLPINYTVQSGDTLAKISRTFGVSVGLLVLENNIENPDLIYAGKILTIPNPTEAISVNKDEGKLIVVILTLQHAYAFEDGVLVREFVVSTGLPGTPTVLGNYTILDKVESARMTGPGYDLPDVPWIMHFYQGYAFHGTYWHDNFGHPMSHGCVNMKTDEAKWLYDWADIGTPVEVRP